MRLSPDLLLSAYSQGAFPMADPARGGRVDFYAPDPRAVIPLDPAVPDGGLRVTRSLRQSAKRFEVACDRGFEATMRACAAPAPGREETWISDEIVRAYVALHRLRMAHSVECWDAEGFAGGLYGVALGGAFFGESMVSLRRDASKVALAHLVRRLVAGGFVLLDVQIQTPHLERLGAVEIPRPAYERRLAAALHLRADWSALDRSAAPGADAPVHDPPAPGVAPGP